MTDTAGRAVVKCFASGSEKIQTVPIGKYDVDNTGGGGAVDAHSGKYGEMNFFLQVTGTFFSVYAASFPNRRVKRPGILPFPAGCDAELELEGRIAGKIGDDSVRIFQIKHFKDEVVDGVVWPLTMGFAMQPSLTAWSFSNLASPERRIQA